MRHIIKADGYYICDIYDGMAILSSCQREAARWTRGEATKFLAEGFRFGDGVRRDDIRVFRLTPKKKRTAQNNPCAGPARDAYSCS